MLYMTTVGLVLLVVAFGVLLGIIALGFYWWKKSADTTNMYLENLAKERREETAQRIAATNALLEAFHGFSKDWRHFEAQHTSFLCDGLQNLGSEVHQLTNIVGHELRELAGAKSLPQQPVQAVYHEPAPPRPAEPAPPVPQAPPANIINVAEMVRFYSATANGSFVNYSSFGAKYGASSFGLINPEHSEAVGAYEFVDYRFGGPLPSPSMMLVPLDNGEALLFPAFKRATRAQRNKFKTDGLHKFFQVSWSEDYPSLQKPAKVRLRGDQVYEIIEMGVLT